MVTWNEGTETPEFERGLPEEIHFWKTQRELFILRDASWHRWERGTPIKEVGLNVERH